PDGRAGPEIGGRRVSVDERPRDISDIGFLFVPEDHGRIEQIAEDSIAGIGNARPPNDKKQLAGPSAVRPDDETDRQSQDGRQGGAQTVKWLVFRERDGGSEP